MHHEDDDYAWRQKETIAERYAGRVVDKHRAAFDVDITRPSVWGNPYIIGRDGDRDQVIHLYRRLIYAPGQKAFRNKIRRELYGKVLGCVCQPQACHGDILLEVTMTPMED